MNPRRNDCPRKCEARSSRDRIITRASPSESHVRFDSQSRRTSRTPASGGGDFSVLRGGSNAAPPSSRRNCHGSNAQKRECGGFRNNNEPTNLTTPKLGGVNIPISFTLCDG